MLIVWNADDSCLCELIKQAENCVDAEVVYKFLEANKIGATHASFYISYALQMELKNKNKAANEIFNRGLSM